MPKASTSNQGVSSQVVSQWTLGVEEELKQPEKRNPAPLSISIGKLETCLDATSFWVIFSFPKGGKLALRTCFDPGRLTSCAAHPENDTCIRYQIEGALGVFTVRVEWPNPDQPMLHYTTSLRSHQSFTLESLPRDVYVLDAHYQPHETVGRVYTSQNGPTSGTVFFSVDQPRTGTVLYFQNLTALNAYCQQTQTDPSGTVGVQWPELGLSLPTSEKPLIGGKELVISDAYLFLTETIPVDEYEAADHFLEAIAQIYRYIPKPKTEYYDWPSAATQTLRTLASSDACGRRINGKFYLNAYVGSDYKPPESMVQMAILLPLLDYQIWTGNSVDLADQLRKSVYSFFDQKLGTIVRWLPGTDFTKADADLSEEEDQVRMDSWYLLYSLLNLGRLAKSGDQEAQKMFLRSLVFVIKAAHHFDYEWPVFYNIHSLKVYKDKPKPGTTGEHDVPGLFTHVMIQAYELTQDEKYLKEAETSARMLMGKGFELLYQTNNTIMSAVTMAKLWRITSNRLYFDLSKVCMASVVAKMWMWDCQFGYAKHYTTFMGVSCLQDAEYVASYEEEEAFSAALEYLKLVELEVSPALGMLLAEYMKYLLHRGRYYLPAELPDDAVADEPREGHIQPMLPIPLEDLRTGWQQAGQVGQEVYGSASALVLATSAYLRLPSVPVIIYTEYPILRADFRNRTAGSGEVTFTISGTEDFTCRLRVLANQKRLPLVRLVQLTAGTERECKAEAHTDDLYEFRVPGGSRFRIDWERKPTSRTKKS
ncbi:hypothetical protein [Spirosoma fluminis]